jgi:hypothetical protein
MRGRVGSLNAAVAGSILLFEAVAQRDPDAASAPPRPEPLPDEVDDEVAGDVDDGVGDEVGDEIAGDVDDGVAGEGSGNESASDVPQPDEPSPEDGPVTPA